MPLTSMITVATEFLVGTAVQLFGKEVCDGEKSGSTNRADAATSSGSVVFADPGEGIRSTLRAGHH